jgi:excisionase family DNA binding protein
VSSNLSIAPGDLLTVAEAAALLHIKPSTVRAWLTQAKLPRVKLGRLTRILRQDCEALIYAGRMTAGEHSAPPNVPSGL